MAGAPTSKAHQRQAHANKNRHAAYFGDGKKDQNKAKKIAQHLKAHPWDGKAFETLKAISPTILKKAHVKVPDRVELSPVIIRREAGVTLTQQRKAARRACTETADV